MKRALKVIKGIGEDGVAELCVEDNSDPRNIIKLSLEAVQVMKLIASAVFEKPGEVQEMRTSIGIVSGENIDGAYCRFNFLSLDRDYRADIVFSKDEIMATILMMEDSEIKIPALDDSNGVVHGLRFNNLSRSVNKID